MGAVFSQGLYRTCAFLCSEKPKTTSMTKYIHTSHIFKCDYPNCYREVTEAVTVAYLYDRRADAAGGMENRYVKLDLCQKCAEGALSRAREEELVSENQLYAALWLKTPVQTLINGITEGLRKRATKKRKTDHHHHRNWVQSEKEEIEIFFFGQTFPKKDLDTKQWEVHG